MLGVPFCVECTHRLASPATQVPGPFSRQIELAETFADQAVIAIENVRLFEEIQARNREVTAAFEQQTATSEVLRVIAAPPTDVQPVLQVVESATRFCDTYDALVYLAAKDLLFLRRTMARSLDGLPLPINRDTVTGRACADLETQHVRDLRLPAKNFPGQSWRIELPHDRRHASDARGSPGPGY